MALGSRSAQGRAASKLRALLGPGLSTLAMLAILIGLGTWQVQRLAWKNGILAAIEQAERSPAIPLPSNPAPFAKVSATGVLRADLPARFGADVGPTREGFQMGSQLIMPLQREGADPVLVDLGWLPDKAAVSLPGGEVTLQAYVRPPQHAGWLAVHDNLQSRRFYTLDPAVIGNALGLPKVAPFVLVALDPPLAPSGVPEPAQHLPRPPNNHLEYALTWYGLAVVLAMIFASYALSVVRE
ncbi:MAG: SURF1 family protein [Acetobacteraceae bacterium]|nr:SURF1 family protein [Acetobacteraceae bacterium]MBV8520981.1 SURF1 family protein [Acetobacteraceae bacterium]